MTIPTNLADAIAGMRDGTIGVQQIMIGDVIVSALGELRMPVRKDITRRPVQAGYSVSKGIIDTPDEIEMDIVLANPDYSPEGLVGAAINGDVESLTETWVEKKDQIYSDFNEKKIISFTTHEQGFPPIYAIEMIDPKYNAEEDWEGWIGTVRLVKFGIQSGATSVDLADAKKAATVYVGSF